MTQSAPLPRRYGMTDITYYELLNIAPDASDVAVRSAYRVAAKRHHPDTNPQDRALATKRFALIQQAYDVLRDPVQRAAYDTELRQRRWIGSMARNDNLEHSMTDVVTRVRHSLERLMRVMARERDVIVRKGDHGG